MKEIIDNALLKMKNTHSTFSTDLQGLRTGRANSSILDCIVVKVYNDTMRLSQVATVNVASAKLLIVNVWDKNNAELVKKAIANSNLGLNPSLELSTIKVPLPDLSEERRKKLVKTANDYAEHTRQAIRNIRRDAISSLRVLNKNNEISEDDLHKSTNSIQKITTEAENNVTSLLKSKTAEILNVR